MKPLPNIRIRNLYNQFHCIEETAHYDIVRFFDSYSDDISIMPEGDSMEIHKAFLESLFIIGRYNRFMEESQFFLERLLNSEFFYNTDKDVYRLTVLRRAVAAYHTGQHAMAEEIVREALRMNPYQETGRKLLRQIEKNKFKTTLNIVKASLILMIIVVACLIIVEQVVVISFFPDFAEQFLNIIMLVSMPIFLFLFCVHCYILFVARNRFYRFIRQHCVSSVP